MGAEKWKKGTDLVTMVWAKSYPFPAASLLPFFIVAQVSCIPRATFFPWNGPKNKRGGAESCEAMQNIVPHPLAGHHWHSSKETPLGTGQQIFTDF